MGNYGLYGDLSGVITDPKQKEQVIMIGVDPTVRKNLKTPAVQGRWLPKAFVRFYLQSCKERLVGGIQP
jgi:hypothetical protein